MTVKAGTWGIKFFWRLYILHLWRFFWNVQIWHGEIWGRISRVQSRPVAESWSYGWRDRSALWNFYVPQISIFFWGGVFFWKIKVKSFLWLHSIIQLSPLFEKVRTIRYQGHIYLASRQRTIKDQLAKNNIPENLIAVGRRNIYMEICRKIRPLASRAGKKNYFLNKNSFFKVLVF